VEYSSYLCSLTTNDIRRTGEIKSSTVMAKAVLKKEEEEEEEEEEEDTVHQKTGLKFKEGKSKTSESRSEVLCKF